MDSFVKYLYLTCDIISIIYNESYRSKEIICHTLPILSCIEVFEARSFIDTLQSITLSFPVWHNKYINGVISVEIKQQIFAFGEQSEERGLIVNASIAFVVFCRRGWTRRPYQRRGIKRLNVTGFPNIVAPLARPPSRLKA